MDRFRDVVVCIPVLISPAVVLQSTYFMHLPTVDEGGIMCSDCRSVCTFVRA